MSDSGETTGRGPSAGAGWRTVERLLRVPVRSGDSRLWIALILAFGTVFRLCQYFADRQLWMDEVSLAENLREKSLAELFGPLLFMQLAPAGFLVVEGLVVRVLGFSRLALRLFPLVCGIVSLGLFATVGATVSQAARRGRRDRAVRGLG